MQSSKTAPWTGLTPSIEDTTWELPRTVHVKEKRVFLVIHSKDRDILQYPSPSSYRVDIANLTGDCYSNVNSISLHSAIIPNCNSVLSEPYLLLKIEELSGSAFAGTNSASQKAMALVMLDKSYDTKFINIRPDTCRTIQERLTRPYLTTMTISLTNQYGVPFNFGTDVGAVINDNIQHTLVFEIIHTVNEIKA